ncbi:Endopolyphosphatase [Poronia punctata]|nr:Endopolyphosphatase [Poronia punctata]
MGPLKVLQRPPWATTLIIATNLLGLVLGVPAPESPVSQLVPRRENPGIDQVNHQYPLATASVTSHRRRLHGKFLHITDLHPDEYYKSHTSTQEDYACHRGHGPAGAFGAETSDCDSPMSLVNATLTWVRENLRDEIDFVVWTGDSARHDSDEEIPRHNKDILSMNRQIADAFFDTFSDDTGLVIPVVPTFGNNDIYPHNILMPGPNEILRTYSSIWKEFIPNTQRHSFEFGGWFYVEVIPSELAVFSLNTMYFFDRNAGIDDCAHPSQPGYKHFEWLAVQLDYLRSRGMKAILMGHVPPARTQAKQLWDETCWQKYTLWLQQYRDVIVGGLYGHMNIDHFLLQDTRDIDITSASSSNDDPAHIRTTMTEDFGIQSSADYLKELREDWAKLPDPAILNGSEKAQSGNKATKKKKKQKKKLGGPWAERYQLTLIAPSIVPNYFPSLRVFEYNITGLEESPTWAEYERISSQEVHVSDEKPELGELRRRESSDIDIAKKKKKGKKGKKPKDPNLQIPDPPEKGSLPGPAYYPQTLTLLGYTQYYANLTYINDDITDDPKDDALSNSGWNPGKHKGKSPKHDKPRPREFGFEVEYSTFDDKFFELKDLTVKSYVSLAHRIGQATAKGAAFEDEEGDAEDVENDSKDDLVTQKKKSGKAGKKHKKKKGHKLWLHFLKHAFVSTKSKEELEKL